MYSEGALHSPVAACVAFALLWVVSVLSATRLGRGHVGLGYIYLINFAIIHYVSVFVALFDNDGTFVDSSSLRGAWIACIALLGFPIVSIYRSFLRRAIDRKNSLETERVGLSYRQTRRLLLAYLIGGALMRLFSFSPIARIPSMVSVISAAGATLEAAIGAIAWMAYVRRDVRRFTQWLFLAAVLPVFTIVSQGFLGYGTVALLVVLGVVSSFYRPRWQLVLAWAVLVYLGLSFYVTYMRDRDVIRAAVWGGAPISQRISLVTDLVFDIEFFRLGDQEQADRIDIRLNQNRMVGLAAENLDLGRVDYARGSTIYDIVFALIPRAMWPGKPQVGGSGEIVSRYTGLTFAEGTSVGVGHVLELYVNGGPWLVFLGFTFIGGLLAIVDERAGLALHYGDMIGYFRWIVPAISLLQVGGSLRETIVAAVAGVVGVTLITSVLKRLGYRRIIESTTSASNVVRSRRGKFA